MRLTAEYVPGAVIENTGMWTRSQRGSDQRHRAAVCRVHFRLNGPKSLFAKMRRYACVRVVEAAMPPSTKGERSLAAC